MIALPLPSQLTPPRGQTDAAGQPGQAGQPDRRATGAGTPIYRLSYDAGAPLYLVKLYITRFVVAHTWVIGWPGPFLQASDCYRRIDLLRRDVIDECLSPVGWWSGETSCVCGCGCAGDPERPEEGLPCEAHA